MLPPALLALLRDRGVTGSRFAAVLTPEWLLDAASAYDAIDPIVQPMQMPHLHPAYAVLIRGL